MFEHFGIKDIFCGLWRFKYLIIAGTIIGVLGGYFFLSSDNEINEEHKEYYMSETWYFGNTTSDAQDNTESDLRPAKTFNALLDSDMCSGYVKERLLEIYSEEELLKIFGNEGNANGFTWEIMTKNMSHLLGDGEESVSLAMKLKDEECVRTIMSIYDDFAHKLQQEMQTTYPGITVTNLGMGEEIYVSSPDGMSAKESSVLGAMLGFVVSCIIVFFICLWMPTVNRKSDFDEYGLFVLGKVEEIKK